MLSKKYRLPKNDIPIIARRGRRYSSELFDIKVWWDDKLENPLFTFVISKKTHKSAVKRNIAKRKFRAAMYKLIKDGNMRTGKYMFLIKNIELINMSSEKISELVIKILKK